MKGRRFDWYDEDGKPHWLPDTPPALPPMRRFPEGFKGWDRVDLDQWAAERKAARLARACGKVEGTVGEGTPPAEANRN